MRRLLIILSIPVALVIIAVILLSVLLDKEKILALASEQVKKQTGSARLSLHSSDRPG